MNNPNNNIFFILTIINSLFFKIFFKFKKQTFNWCLTYIQHVFNIENLS